MKNNNFKKLNKQELNELKGGNIYNLDDDSLELPKRNVNTTGYCSCNYKDTSVIKNINRVTTCICSCN